MLEKFIIDIPDLDSNKPVTEIMRQLYEIEYVCEEIMLENENLKASAKKEMPIIHLMISSNGGLLSGAISIISMVEKLKRMGCFIITECCSHALSAGFFIFMSGDIRLATYPKMAKWLYHYALTSTGFDNVNILIDNLDLVKDDMEVLKEYTIERSNITKEQLDEYDRKDWWLRYDEAKELGIIKENFDEDIEEEVELEIDDIDELIEKAITTHVESEELDESEESDVEEELDAEEDVEEDVKEDIEEEKPKKEVQKKSVKRVRRRR